jgi:hypothetical protein
MAHRYGRFTPAQAFALAFGVVYMMIGLIGFGVTGFNDWFTQIFVEKLLFFPINPIHNIIHIALGTAWMVSSTTHAQAKRMNTILGVVLIAVTLLGVVGVAKWAAIESGFAADNILHLVTALLSLYFGFADETGRPSRAR